MEVRPGYKQTEVGVIPDNWETEPLLHIGQWFSGGTPSLSNESYWSGDIPWVSPKDMKQLRLSDAIDHISQKAIADGARVLPVGSILMVIRGMILAHSFPVARVERPLAFNQDIKAVVPRTDVDSNFVLYWLIANKQRLRSLITESTHGTKRLPSETLFKSTVCLPPFPEQRAIAAALSDVDALLTKLDQFIAKKRDLKQAAMQQLLTGQTRLPGFSGEWEVKRLGDVGEIAGSGIDKKVRPDESPVRLVNYMDAYRKDFIYSEDLDHWVTASSHQARRCMVLKGDVFFTPSSETRDDIANSAVAMEDIADAGYSYHVVRLRLKEPWDFRFRTYAFKTRAFLAQAETLCDGGGTRYVISLGKFRSLTVNVPPILEQAAIATVLSDMDIEIAALEARRDKTRAIKQGMMQELLTGRIRLI